MHISSHVSLHLPQAVQICQQCLSSLGPIVTYLCWCRNAHPGGTVASIHCFTQRLQLGSWQHMSMSVLACMRTAAAVCGSDFPWQAQL